MKELEELMESTGLFNEHFSCGVGDMMMEVSDEDEENSDRPERELPWICPEVQKGLSQPEGGFQDLGREVAGSGSFDDPAPCFYTKAKFVVLMCFLIVCAWPILLCGQLRDEYAALSRTNSNFDRLQLFFFVPDGL